MAPCSCSPTSTMRNRAVTEVFKCSIKQFFLYLYIYIYYTQRAVCKKLYLDSVLFTRACTSQLSECFKISVDKSNDLFSCRNDNRRREHVFNSSFGFERTKQILFVRSNTSLCIQICYGSYIEIQTQISKIFKHFKL